MSDEPALDKGYEYVQPAPTTYEPVFEDDGGPRDSMSTYASTTASAADLPQEQEDPLYEVDDRQEGLIPFGCLCIHSVFLCGAVPLFPASVDPP